MAHLTGLAYTEVDRRTFQRDWPDPEPRTPDRDTAWVRATAHALRTDPEGCWVAERRRARSSGAPSPGCAS